jgi:hypothetical protein
VKYSNTGTSFGYGARFKRCLVEVLVHEIDGRRDLRWHDMLSHVMTCDKIKQINKNKISILSKKLMSTTLIYLHYTLIRIFTKFLWSFSGQIYASHGSRLQALFGVSILEDKGHARNELLCITCQVWFANFRLYRLNIFRPSLKKIVGFYQVLFWISDSESGQRLIWSQVWNITVYQARIQTDATDASASVKIFTRTRFVNILLKSI